jgi:hypothetical protein
MAIPAVCAFGVGCVVSICTMVFKIGLLAKKHCSSRAEVDGGIDSLDGVEVPHEFANHDSIKQLKSKFHENKLAVKKMYCALALGLFEGRRLPNSVGSLSLGRSLIHTM